MLLSGANAVVPSGTIEPEWLRLASGRIAAVGPGLPPPLQPGEQHFELAGRVILPGFIDLHVHGGGGSYTSGDDHGVRLARAFHCSAGTTRSLASLVTAPLADVLAALSLLAELAESGVIAGIHLEGPFLSHAFCGAQDPRYLLAPDRELLDQLFAAARGRVRMVTIAPELPGAIDLVRRVVDAGAIAAIGHSNATYAEASAAIDAGASVATHLYNGMRPVHQREPGIVVAALEREEVVCDLVADGHHVHRAMLGLAFAVAAVRVALVTDAISAAGGKDGRYRLGAAWVDVEGGDAYLEGTRTIAGSTTTMEGAVRHAALEAGIPLPVIARAASGVPARLLGVADELGTIEAGKAADLVVLDADLHVEAVSGGHWLRRGSGSSVGNGSSSCGSWCQVISASWATPPTPSRSRSPVKGVPARMLTTFAADHDSCPSRRLETYSAGAEHPYPP